jgi:hypothetical protein
LTRGPLHPALPPRDLTIKEKALALVTPVDVKPGSYKPPDQLLAFLEAL